MPNPCGQHDSDESTTKQEIICHLSSVLMPPLPKFAISRSASPMIDPAVPAGGRGLLRPRHYLMAPAPAINAHPLEDGTPAFLLSLPNIVSLGTLNATHRVTRRKSMTSTGANTAAIAAALAGNGQPPPHLNRHSLTSKGSGSGRGSEPASGKDDSTRPQSSYASTLNRDDAMEDDDIMQDEDAAVDGMPRGRADSGTSKARTRRASEGAYLSKGEGKRGSGELRCEKCGKGYKHSSCLTKHLWEHRPEWSYTSKLLISKHQQVQLLEAASVLVGMNQDGSTPSDAVKTIESDHSSTSPAMSASSELQDDDISSAETTPPPVNDPADFHDRFGTARTKRNSGTSSAFSRSYQSAPSSSFLAGSVPSSSYGQQYQGQRRPSTSGLASVYHGAVDEDEAGLAAAVQSLCSFGTPRSGPVQLPSNVPPVPPLPPQYVGQNTNRRSGNFMTPTLQDIGLPPAASQRISNERGSKTEHYRTSHQLNEDDYDQHSILRHRHDDDEDGVFGRMDE
ncbi:MAG: hypothetical protein LQ348_004392 [Seirophora lacunosa]|nr:MAG: hypothetical protein LQ348_004392 [Seirophora lacunosa]